MTQHLTDANIKKLPAPAKGNRITYDTDVKGFGIRITAAGAMAFILNYVTRGGRQRRHTIGGSSNWSTVAARVEARRLKQEIDRGGDPLGDIEDERAAPTVSDLCDRFLSEHVVRLRATTAGDYLIIVDKYIKPALGTLKVADVAYEDIDALHRKITNLGKKVQANRCAAVLSKMFNLAVKWRMRSDNPCKGTERNGESKRVRYLKADEMARLVEALAKHSDQQTSNIIRLLLLTGCRKGEALSALWADFDLTAGTWSKPASSTKQNRPHVVPLSAPARMLLKEIQDQQAGKHRRGVGAYVFPPDHSSENAHRVDIDNGWRSICEAADITDLRIHDLRHSFASELVSGGVSLAAIGALLGHSSPKTTSRYAHLFDDPLKAAVEHVGRVVSNAGKPPLPEPEQLRPRRG